MKEYIKPMMDMELFAANEYFSACGEENKVYNFKCDAPGGTLYYYPTSDGEINGKYNGTGSASRLGGYHPCSATHEASVTSDFYDGFVDYNRNGRQDDGEGVIVWLEYGKGWFGSTVISDYHATTILDMNTWVTAKS